MQTKARSQHFPLLILGQKLEKEQEEREKRLREEQEKREHEEYLKLKQEFVIEEEGQDESLSEENEQNLLQKFIEFIKKSKVVILEDLAAEFKLKTQVIKLLIHQRIIKVTFIGCYKSN